MPPSFYDWREKISRKNINDTKATIETGIYNPLFTWNNYVIDGRKRFLAYSQNAFDYGVPVLEFADLPDCIEATIYSNQISITEVIRYFTFFDDARIIEILCKRYDISNKTIVKYIERTPDIAVKLFNFEIIKIDDVLAINKYCEYYKLSPYEMYRRISRYYITDKKIQPLLEKIHTLKILK